MRSGLTSIYRRVLLKLSGESLMGGLSHGVDPSQINQMALAIKATTELGVQVAVVIGGGNFARGRSWVQSGFQRITADHIGMLATVMNGLALRDGLEQVGVGVHLASALAIDGLVERTSSSQVLQHLNDGVVIFVAGMGHPFFSTDTAACLRAIEIDADIVLKGTQVDGIYTADPALDSSAEKYESISYDDVLRQRLGVMDLTAISLCQTHQMPIQVFDITQPHALTRCVTGQHRGTMVGSEE